MENKVPIIPVVNLEMWRPWVDEPVEAPNYFPNKRSVKQDVETRPCRQESDALLDPSLPTISTTDADNLVNMERTQPDLLTPSGLLEEKFFCDTCQESFISTNILQNHLCAEKSKKMSSSDELNKLYSSKVKTKSDKVGTLYSANTRNNASNWPPLGVTQRSDTKTIRHHCDQCETSFASLSHLTEHKRIHTGERPYRCDECSMSFKRKDHLKRHMLIHTGEKPYRCGKCPMTFKRNSHLKSHMRTHTGEKPYPCDKCSMSFTQSNNLKTHMLTHTGERPYPCDECPMTFTQNTHLKRHMLTHTGEKPFKCDRCNYSSSQSGSLTRHKRIHTV